MVSPLQCCSAHFLHKQDEGKISFFLTFFSLRFLLLLSAYLIVLIT